MTGSAYPLAARLYVRPAGNDPKADAYLAVNCLLLWRRRMTNVLLSPYVAPVPGGTSRNSTNFQSHASLTPRPRQSRTASNTSKPGPLCKIHLGRSLPNTYRQASLRNGAQSPPLAD